VACSLAQYILSLEKRLLTSPGGKPAVYTTQNAWKSWRRLDAGFPKSQGWFTVKRQAMTADAHKPGGIYFGTTAGEVWASTNEGLWWSGLVRLSGNTSKSLSIRIKPKI
jgi:hypothetical protein